jgi:GDP-L-fucose synthase
MTDDTLLTGKLELTNEPYAIAKIAGIKLCESYNRQYGKSHGLDYRSVMPTNLYGPGDSYHPENSHVIPALLRRFHEAKLHKLPEVVIWGSGEAKREFLYVDDMAHASVFVMQLDKEIYSGQVEPMQSHVNVGFGSDVTIAELAQAVAKAVSYEGRLVFDASKPNGSPKKLMDSSKINHLERQHHASLQDRLNIAYAAFVQSSVASV